MILEPGGRPRTSGFSRRKLRWGLAGLIIAAIAALLAWQWLFTDRMRQNKVIFTVELVGGGGLLLFAAWLFFSSRPRRLRLLVFLAAAAMVGISGALLRIRGVTGDLVPLLAWRWSAPPEDDSMTGEPADGAAGSEATSAAARVPSADYPQFLGPDRSGILRGVKLARDWAARPPRQVWRRPIGAGWSSFAVREGIAVTQEQHGEEERVSACDLLTGKPIWSHQDPGKYSSVIAGDGPRATPTIHAGRVYTLGALGRLNCLDWKNGRVVWTADIQDGKADRRPEWGAACSPLAFDGLVVVSGAGADARELVAFQDETGAVAWRATAGSPSYSSPLLADLAGLRQILILNHSSLTAHDPASGDLLWKFPWPGQQPKVSQPVRVGSDGVFLSSGYGVGCELIRIGRPEGGGKPSPASLWKNNNMKTKFTNSVVLDGKLYGLDDGILACLDAAGGERLWKAGRYGHGQILLVENLLIIQAESGDVVLVEPVPAGLRELSRMPALNAKTWNNPSFPAPFLLVRNDREAACYELPLEP